MVKRVILIAIAVFAIAGGAVAYSFFKTPEEASSPIQAIPLAVASPTARPVSAAPTTAPAASGSGGQASQPAASQATLFEIAQEGSEARFIINEVLEGAPKTVVGTTNQVAGQIAVDPANPAQSQVGVIQINARTLKTDNDMRNRAIKNRILQTDSFEFVTFTPKQLAGLPASAAVGQPITFQMTGDLTIKGVTREATFDVTVTPVSADRLEGLASTTIRYQDFDIQVPRAPMVASVEETVKLELQFVAGPKSS